MLLPNQADVTLLQLLEYATDLRDATEERVCAFDSHFPNHPKGNDLKASEVNAFYSQDQLAALFNIPGSPDDPRFLPLAWELAKDVAYEAAFVEDTLREYDQ